MISIAALTTGKNDPSARFRVRQFIEPLSKHGFAVHEYCPRIDKHAGLPSVISGHVPQFVLPLFDAAWKGAKLATRIRGVAATWRAQITWLNRELLPGRYTLEGIAKRPYVFDVDDAIWQARPHGHTTVIKIANQAAVVIAGNAHIAEWFTPHAREVRIVPTAVDTNRFLPRDYTSRDKPFVVGWTGSAGNYVYLYRIEDALAHFLDTHDAELLVMAERPPQFTKLAPSKVRYVEWSLLNETQTLREMDVGLMPLTSTDWTRGKCGFKMLQYMATAVPVIVTPVGVNANILAMANVGFAAEQESDWYDALHQLYERRDMGPVMGRNGRAIVEQQFSRDVIAEMLAGIFRALV